MNGGLSEPADKESRYRQLQNQYRGCTYLDGNLELTWLQNDKPDLSFLQDIREVTGYVVISNTDLSRIILPRLQIIHGRNLLKISRRNEKFGLLMTHSATKSLEIPALRGKKKNTLYFGNCQGRYLKNFKVKVHKKSG